MKIVLSFVKPKSIKVCVLAPTGISVLKGDAEVCGTSPCWGVISLQAAAGAPVGNPWMLGTRISRKALATAQVNTVDLWHDIPLFDCELNWPVCPTPRSIYTKNHIARLYLSNKDCYKLAIYAYWSPFWHCMLPVWKKWWAKWTLTSIFFTSSKPFTLQCCAIIVWLFAWSIAYI